MRAAFRAGADCSTTSRVFSEWNAGSRTTRPLTTGWRRLRFFVEAIPFTCGRAGSRRGAPFRRWRDGGADVVRVLMEVLSIGSADERSRTPRIFNPAGYVEEVHASARPRSLQRAANSCLLSGRPAINTRAPQ